MPHLIETYALNCGLKIDKPYIYEKFFPLIADRFITIHPNSKYDSKCYDYWQEVVDFLSPELAKEKISIVQIGTKDDKPIKGCLHTQGQTSINQASYIVGRAELHFGADSFAAHVASAMGKKIVCLYSNNFAEVVRPYWSKESDRIMLEPDRKGKRPNFSEKESPKTINEIKPEKIAESVLKLLNLDSQIGWKTILRGPKYMSANVQSIPNSVVNPKAINVDSMIMRMDVEHNEKILAAQLAVCDCSILSKLPIDLEILSKFKSKIKQFVYEIDENHNPAFALNVKNLGIETVLYNSLSEDKLKHIKMDYFDVGVLINKPKINPEDVIKLRDLGLENLYYKSKKYTISNGKIYPSVAEAKFGTPLSSLSTESKKVIDEKIFWDDLEDFYLFQKLN